ncbi:hypothetical protein [Bradyrhizobium sp. CCBAU 53340]|uniref:hypothetical protein n=1 Tax=Bradyrhizobium sp. CCBAU 53340 TaxID=1325112 RepID=UPI00188AC14F|nr:hypothetical protein [Bradyrhizobium sp. CCBAU 53340]
MSIIKPTGLRPGWRKIMIVVTVVVAAMLGYGAWMYPDAPFRKCSVGIETYCGKGGKQRTPSEYEDFRKWENTLIFVVWPIAVSLQILAALFSRQKKR